MGLTSGSGVGPFSPLTHCIPSSPLPGTPTPLLNCVVPFSHHLSNESLPSVYRLASLSAALKKKKKKSSLPLNWLKLWPHLWLPLSAAELGNSCLNHFPHQAAGSLPQGFHPHQAPGRPNCCQIQRSILSLPLRSIPGIPGGPALYSCTDLSTSCPKANTFADEPHLCHQSQRLG